MQNPTCLSAKELARRWTLSHRTLERWRLHDEGPAYMKLGGRVAYRLEDIEAYEAEQIRQATPGVRRSANSGVSA